MEFSEKSPKSGRGGARSGAGRKSQDNARNIRASFMLSAKASEALARASEEQGCSRNDVINRLLESLPDQSL